MTNLGQLRLSNNQISNISPLAGLTNLEYLGLADNQISDLSALSGLTNLGRLRLSNNQISDISPLSALTNLRDVPGLPPFIPEEAALTLEGNPLNAEACCVYIPLIQSNNPDATVTHDPCPPTVLTQSATQGGVWVCDTSRSLDV